MILSEADHNESRHQPLTVLPNSGKVDALRQELAPAPARSSPAPFADNSLISRFLDRSKTPAQKAIIEKVVEACRAVYDPEIPVNIFDLGLIYAIEVDPQTNRVVVKMTLTAPGCPVAGSLPAEVERRIEMIDEVPGAVVELVWEPQWTKEMMSESALLELGLL
jgi:FeS assembly SUF system protein